MNLNIRFKGFEGSGKLKEYMETRSKKLDKFLPPTTTLNATLEDDKVRKVVELNLNHKGTQYIASHDSDNLYTSIDDAIDKIVRQLSRAKEKKQRRATSKIKEMDMEVEADV